MAKIKRKVEMTLPELIEWAWENEVSDKAFYSNLDGGSVYFDKIQNLSIEHEIAINETFTVEIEEEIDEDTVSGVSKDFKNVVEETKVVTYYNASIEFSKSKRNNFLSHSERRRHNDFNLEERCYGVMTETLSQKL